MIHNTFLIDYFDVKRCYKIFQRNYYWINMIRNVRSFVNNYYICVKIKYSKNKYNKIFKFLSIFNLRWIDLSMNFIIELFFIKNDWNVKCIIILIIINRFFKNLVYEIINNFIFEKIIKIFLRIIIFRWIFFWNFVIDKKRNSIMFFENNYANVVTSIIFFSSFFIFKSIIRLKMLTKFWNNI